MIVILLIWSYLTCIFLIYGVGMIALLRRGFSFQVKKPASPTVTILLGLMFAAWLSSLTSLVLKLGWVAHLLLVAGALFILYFQHEEIKLQFRSLFSPRHWTFWILIALTFITTLLYAVKAPDNPDTTLYHAQAIHWIEEYPAVPGLGNIEPRLGSNSNWFTLNALFSFSFLGLQSFHLIPSFLFLISIFYFLSGLQNLLAGDVRLSQIVKLGFVSFSIYALVDEISSPGMDLPIILFYWLILCLWLEFIEDETSSSLSLFVFLFSILVVTFKVSGIPILLIALVVMFNAVGRKDFSVFSKYIFLAIIILLPWLIRNFILTGYWLYPEPLMQVFSPTVDWQVPAERVLSFKRGVQVWALAPGTTWDEVAGLSIFARLSFWFSELTLNQKAITLIALISPLLFVFSSLFDRQKNRMFYSVIAVSYISVLFWLFTAPNLRFGYGFVLGAIVLALAPFVMILFQNFSSYKTALLLVLVLVLSLQQVRVILGSTRDDTQYREHVLLPADYIQVQTDACNLDGADIFCARKYRQCSYDAFPCVAQIPKNVELRGDTFRDGFRRNPTNP